MRFGLLVKDVFVLVDQSAKADKVSSHCVDEGFVPVKGLPPQLLAY